MPDDVARCIACYAKFLTREIGEAQTRGVRGRWTSLMRRLDRIGVSANDATQDRISVEHRALIAAFDVLRPDVRARAAALAERFRGKEQLPSRSPWAGLDPHAERVAEHAMRVSTYRAEAALIGALARYRRSGRFTDLEDALAGLEAMAAAADARVTPPSVATYTTEAWCLERALEGTMSLAAVAFFISFVRDAFGRLAGISTATPPNDPSRFARAPIGSWITGGAWIGRVQEPDVAGLWFRGDLQRRFRAEQRAWQRSIDREEHEKQAQERARQQAELERARAAEAEEQRVRREAVAREEARRAAQRERAIATEREREARMRELEEARAKEVAEAANDAQAHARFQAWQDEQIDAVIAADLRARGVEPTPHAIRRERKARGANRPGGGLVVW